VISRRVISAAALKVKSELSTAAVAILASKYFMVISKKNIE
jgi:hypothetical protein